MSKQKELSDAQIADKLDGLDAGGLSIKRCPEVYLSGFIYVSGESASLWIYPAEFLAHCRAVVEKIDGKSKGAK